MPKKSSPSKKDDASLPYIPIIAVSVIGAILYFAFLSVIALIFLNSSVDKSLYFPIAIIAGGFTGFICGFIIAKILKEKGIFYGAVTGLLQSVISSAVIFIMNKGVAGNGIFLLLAITTFLSSLGGIAAVNIKKKIKY